MIGRSAMNEARITIRVNGEEQEFGPGTLAALLREKDVADARGVAVAVNGAVVPRAAWRATHLHAGDSVEIVRARQGG
jgi:sulfur carrier protein